MLLVLLAGAALAQESLRYAPDGKMIFPTDYRGWVFLSSGFDMSYVQSGESGPHMFNNVFVNREAYDAFKKTGAWPDKTMLVLEMRGGSDDDPVLKSGQFQPARPWPVKSTSRIRTRVAGLFTPSARTHLSHHDSQSRGLLCLPCPARQDRHHLHPVLPGTGGSVTIKRWKQEAKAPGASYISAMKLPKPFSWTREEARSGQVRRQVPDRCAHHGDLLPAVLSHPSAQAGKRHALPHRGGVPGGGPARLQALPSGPLLSRRRREYRPVRRAGGAGAQSTDEFRRRLGAGAGPPASA